MFRLHTYPYWHITQLAAGFGPNPNFVLPRFAEHVRYVNVPAFLHRYPSVMWRLQTVIRTGHNSHSLVTGIG